MKNKIVESKPKKQYHLERPDLLSQPWLSLGNPLTKPPREGSKKALLLAALSQGARPEAALRKELGNAGEAIAPLIRLGAVTRTQRPTEEEAKKIFASLFIPLNEEQSLALSPITKNLKETQFRVFLLSGVTGSGKTEIYLQAVKTCLQLHRQALILLPEISLTPQAVERFQERFGSRVAVLHSGLAEKERARQWQRVEKGFADVVIGARSAIFAPLSNIGLIVVDEEHDQSYKQQESPYYQARDLAVKWGMSHQATVLLGTATPSVESFFNAEKGKYELLTLKNRANNQPLPPIEVVNLQESPRQKGVFYLSLELYQKLKENLAAKRQAMIFLNRRGFAAFLTCRACEAPVLCDHCSLALTWHQNQQSLICHSCGARKFYPRSCASCGHEKFQNEGIGTQRVERDLSRLFPQARFLRMDRDSLSRKGELERQMSLIHQKKVDFVVGTQLISKGHDFKGIGLVAVLLADMSLNIPDFRSSERSFQLFSQVVGRAGRGEEEGMALIQTYNPTHRALEAALQHDYLKFFQEEKEKRELLGYPPFARLLLIRISHEKEEKLHLEAKRLVAIFQGILEGERLLGPKEAPHYKAADRFYLQILIQGKSLTRFKGRLKALLVSGSLKSPARISFDVDPATA